MNISESTRINELEAEIESLRTQLSAIASEGPLLGALLRDISERKKIEHRLEEAQQWLHMAQDVGEVAAYRYDFTTGNLSWSPSAYLLYGVAREEAPTLEAWLAAVHPDDRQAVEEKVRSALQRCAELDQQYRLLRPDGSVRWIKDRARVQLDNAGAPDSLVGLNFDVTEEREKAEALSRGAARFAALAETTNAILWAVDEKGRFVAPCDSWEKFTGQSFDEYRGFGWTNAIFEEDRAGALEVWNRACEAHGEYTNEYRLRRYDGELRQMLVRAMPVRDSAGRIIEYAGSNIDITEQVETARLIADREERLGAALAGSGAGTFRWDIKTNALEWDSELDQLFGLAPGQTARSLEAFLKRVHPDDRRAVISACEQCAANGADFDQDFRVIWPDGTVRWLSDRGKTYRDPGGNPAYMTGACIDITERKAAMRRLQDSEERLRIAQEAGEVGTFEWYPLEDRIVGSPRYCELWGHPSDCELSVDGLIAQIHPEDRAASGKKHLRDLNSALSYAEFRIRRADTGEWRWVARQGQLVEGEKGEKRMLGVLYDINERKVAVQQLESVLESITDAFIAVDGDWNVQLFNRAAELHFDVQRSDVLGQPMFEVFSIAAGTQLERDLRRVLDKGEPLLREMESLQHPGRAIELKAAPTPKGGLAISFSDVTDRREAERLRELLVGELQHRTKNMFSIIQATAHQTFKAADVPQPVRSIFNDRIAALSRAHDLVLNEEWDSAALADIVERALGPFVAAAPRRIHWSGPDVVLPARSAIAVTLALHELATNAVKYGSLSVDGGEVEISWSGSAQPSAAFRFEWIERGGPAARFPSRKGFGSGLIERSLSAELQGEVQLVYAEDGFRCTLERDAH